MSARMEIDEEIQMASNGDGGTSCSSTEVKDENEDNGVVQTTDPEEVKDDDKIRHKNGNNRTAQDELQTNIDQSDIPEGACQIEEDDEIDQEKGKYNAAQNEPKKKIDQGGNAEVQTPDKPDQLEAGAALDVSISPEADALIRELNRDPTLMWEDPFQVDCVKTLAAYVKSIRRSDREEYELDLAARGLEQSIATYCARVDYTHQALCDLNAQLDALLDPSNYGKLWKPKTRHQYDEDE